MSDIYIPLQGPTGVRSKAPAVGAWQSPGYAGAGAFEWSAWDDEHWFGLRCDDWVVIDCDTEEACKFWCDKVLTDDEGRRWFEWSDANTWVRKTPNGYHFIYSWTEGSPTAPAAGVWDHIDIRAGRTSQIVYLAPGYETLTDVRNIKPFDPAWLPDNFGKGQQDRSATEAWDEMPDGRGNNTMAAFAGAFRKQGMGVLAIAKCLGAINRITMTRDPMPTETIVEIAKSVSRYAPRPDIDIEVEE